MLNTLHNVTITISDLETTKFNSRRHGRSLQTSNKSIGTVCTKHIQDLDFHKDRPQSINMHHLCFLVAQDPRIDEYLDKGYGKSRTAISLIINGIGYFLNFQQQSR